MAIQQGQRVPPSNKELTITAKKDLNNPCPFIHATDIYQAPTVWQRLGTGLDNED